MTDKFNPFEMVIEFHETFDHPVRVRPTIVDEKERDLRLDLIKEELLELMYAAGSLTMTNDPKSELDSLIEIADALADLMYVTCGMAVSYGIPLDEVFEEVHRSNMSKLWPDGKARYDKNGKVKKGPNFRQPAIKEILEDWMDEGEEDDE